MASFSPISDERYALLLSVLDTTEPVSAELLDRIQISFSFAFAQLETAKKKVITASTDEERATALEICVDRLVSLDALFRCLLTQTRCSQAFVERLLERMKLYLQEQWLLQSCDDPSDWVAELRPLRELAAMSSFLVSLRRLSADMADLAELGPPLGPDRYPPTVERAPPDNVNQAGSTSEALPALEVPAEPTPMAVVPPNNERGRVDEPLARQGMVRNDPEVGRVCRCLCGFGSLIFPLAG